MGQQRTVPARAELLHVAAGARSPAARAIPTGDLERPEDTEAHGPTVPPSFRGGNPSGWHIRPHAPKLPQARFRSVTAVGASAGRPSDETSPQRPATGVKRPPSSLDEPASPRPWEGEVVMNRKLGVGALAGALLVSARLVGVSYGNSGGTTAR